jgi:hypothetical protein
MISVCKKHGGSTDTDPRTGEKIACYDCWLKENKEKIIDVDKLLELEASTVTPHEHTNPDIGLIMTLRNVIKKLSLEVKALWAVAEAADVVASTYVRKDCDVFSVPGYDMRVLKFELQKLDEARRG